MTLANIPNYITYFCYYDVQRENYRQVYTPEIVIIMCLSNILTDSSNVSVHVGSNAIICFL